jgi:membrane-associated phospholipid phosphatase
MLSRIKQAILVLVGFVALMSFANAEDSAGYWSGFYKIPLSAFDELFTDDKAKLTRNAIAVGAVALVYTQDENIYEFWMDNVKNERLDKFTSGFFYDVGTPEGGLLIHGGAALYAYAANDNYLMNTVKISAQSVVISQILTESVKRITGRERPRDSEGDSNLWGEGGMSFFSGHASGSFAAWTVFAERYHESRALYWGFYGLAGLTAVSRLNEDAHWASDILAGSLFGYATAKLSLSYHQTETSRQSSFFLPLIGKDHFGLVYYQPF